MAILLKLFNAAEKIPNQLVATVNLPDHHLDPGMSTGELPLQFQRLFDVLGHHHASRGQPYANTTSYGAEDANTLVHGNFKHGGGGIFAQ
jgi:hypothetical protein